MKTNEELANEIVSNETSWIDGEGYNDCIRCALKMAEFKDRQLLQYLQEHIVPQGDYNMEFADDLVRFFEDKQADIEEIFAQIQNTEIQ